MNLLTRAKTSYHPVFHSPSRVFNLHPASALQQCDFYSTKNTAAHSGQKTQQLTKPKVQRTTGSSTTFSQRVRQQTEALVWPKPGEIPFQAKVANFVNLIGHVVLPVRFQSGSDGKHFATTLISLVSGGERDSLMIPVVFEGDLAHVVSCHVKQNDCVFVSGQLSVDPMKLVLSESLGKFHVVAENINYVEGFKNSVLDKKIGVDKSGKNEVKVSDEMPERVDDDDKPLLNADAESGRAVETLERGDYESQLEKGDEKIGESAGKKKDPDQILDLWRDLVNNPLQWKDYRNQKADGLVKEKYPDFKKKTTGEPLWISSAPKWLFPGIGKLQFDVADMKPKQIKDVKMADDPWRDLVENPNKWWDNRAKKTNPKAPDFRHKETGESLWLNSRSPAWALSKLPPVRN